MKILIITRANLLGETNNGGLQCAVRNWNLLKKIAGQENVYLAMLTENRVRKQTSRVKSFNYKDKVIDRYVNYLFLRDGYGKKTEQELIRYIDEIKPDILFFDGSPFGALVNKVKYPCKKVVFYHNIEKEYAWDRVKHNSMLCVFRYFSNWYNEKILTKKADLRICLNDRDNKDLLKNYGIGADYILPITFEDKYSENVYAYEKPYLLFVGSNFLPNYQGLKWLIEKVMPFLNITLKIVGKDMEKTKEEFSRKNVEVIGTVDDLAPYYHNAIAMVMPIYLGAGMKVKTAEAMMYGKVIFGTKEAFEGYDIQGVSGLYECNTSEQFIKCITEYINSNQMVIMNREVRNLFLEKYETNVKEKDFKDVIEKVVK